MTTPHQHAMRFVLCGLALTAVPSAAQRRPNTLAACAPAPAAECTAFLRIDSAATEMIASAQTPGLAVGIVRNGELVFNKGYGKSNLELDTPVSASTVFPIFSITKTFTAAAILQLSERGRLSIDDKVSKF